MGVRSYSGADGLQVVPDQGGLHAVSKYVGLEVAPIEARSHGSSNFPQQAFGREEKVWHFRPESTSLPEAVQHKPIDITARGKRKRNKRVIWVSISTAILVVLALAIGLAVGLKSKQQAGQDQPSQTTSSPTGSGIATSSPTSSAPLPTTTISPRSARKDTGVLAFYPATENDLVWLYWQDRANDIRSLTYSYDGTWQNSARLPVDDALNGTGLAGTYWWQYSNQTGPQNYMLIYADKDGVLQNLNATVDNATWSKGTLGNSGFKVPMDRRVDMSTCVHPHLFGDQEGGVWVMAGGEDGLVHEYLYAFSNQTWMEGKVFEGTDGYSTAQPGFGAQSTAYLSTVTNSTPPRLEFWYRTFYNGATWEAGAWTKGSDAIDSVRANTTTARFDDVNAVFYIDNDMGLASANTSGNDVGRRWSGSNTTNVKFQSSSQWGRLYITDEKAKQNPSTLGLHIFAQTNATNLVHIQGSVGNLSVIEDIPIFA